ncbi:MAG: hypothetical protein WC605_10320 [Bacteroidales bacterium]
MDDFIYLIALFAWVAFAFYRKSQKKSEAARREQPRPQPRDISSPFPTMKDIFGEGPSIEVVPVPVTQASTTDGMAPELEETAFEKEYKLSGISSIEEMDTPFYIKKTEHTDLQEDELLTENDKIEDWRVRVDLRQAVIYSEILNRPYV